MNTEIVMRVEVLRDTIRITYRTSDSLDGGTGSLSIRINRRTAVAMMNQILNHHAGYSSCMVTDNIWLDINTETRVGTFVCLPAGLAVAVSADDMKALGYELADAVKSIDLAEIKASRMWVAR